MSEIILALVCGLFIGFIWGVAWLHNAIAQNNRLAKRLRGEESSDDF